MDHRNKDVARFVGFIETLEARQLMSVSPQSLTQISGSGYNSINKIIYDSAGNEIIAGLFSGKVDFGAGAMTHQLTARGDTDVFIAKYNAAGSLLFVQQFGGAYTQKAMTEFKKRDYIINPRRLGVTAGRVGAEPIYAGEYVNDVALDSAGNIFIVGNFKQSATIGGTTLTTSDKSYQDAYIIKLSATGTLQFARQFGGQFDDVASSVAIDASNNVYIGGYFTRDANLDPGSTVHIYHALGRDDGYVLKLTNGGAFTWAYQFGSKDTAGDVRDAVNDIAVSGGGVVFFVGSYSGDAIVRTGINQVVLKKSGKSTDAIIGQLNRKGQYVWATSTGGDSYDATTSIALANDGSVYTAGYFSKTVDVDPRTNVTHLLTARGKNNDFTDIVVSKYNFSGTPIWQAQLGGDYYETIGDLAIAPNGSIFLTGSFFGTMDFSPGPAQILASSTQTVDAIPDNNAQFKRKDTYDWYVAQLSINGKYIAHATYGQSDDDYALAIGFDLSGQVVVGGTFVSDSVIRDLRHERATRIVFDDALSPVDVI